MYKHILIPTDGSALSNEALIRSLQLARPSAPPSRS